jgi:hypothetical protein
VLTLPRDSLFMFVVLSQVGIVIKVLLAASCKRQAGSW